MMDTQSVLWAIPGVLIAFAVLAKLVVHTKVLVRKSKLLAERRQSHPGQATTQPISKSQV